jgi:hypothetical protein
MENYNKMNIDDYVFNGSWTLIETQLPNKSERVLFTDGDTIVIGSVTVQDETRNYLFDKPDMEGYTPIAWMDLPNHSIIQKYICNTL